MPYPETENIDMLCEKIALQFNAQVLLYLIITNLQRHLVVYVHVLIKAGHCCWHNQLLHLDSLTVCTNKRFLREVSEHYMYQITYLEWIAH